MFKIASTNFSHEGTIPTRHTCEGEDVSPALSWFSPPVQTKTYALIVDDPDAPDPAKPQRTYVHWVLYNIPMEAEGLVEGVITAQLPSGTREGLNDWSRTGYGGPCPPIGRHRYFFKFYALNAVLPDLGNPSKGKLLEAMQGHIVGEATLIGTYQKNSSTEK